MGLIKDDEIPVVRAEEARLYVILNGEVDGCDDSGLVVPGVLSECARDHVAGERREPFVKSLPHFASPLVRERLGAEHENTPDIVTLYQLPHEEPCHDGLPGAWVVREQEADARLRK